MELMDNFLKKHGGRLKAAALVLMLLIPFFLYAAAVQGSAVQLKIFLALMAGNMLFVMLKG